MANKLSKDDEKMLRVFAKDLPVIMHHTKEVHRLTGAQILEMGFEEYKGKKLIPEIVYEYMMPVQVAANHYNRLKRAWLKNGQAIITRYLKNIATLIKENKETVNA